MKQPDLPQAVFDKMMERDHFSQWLGLELVEIRAGYCKVQMEVRVNGDVAIRFKDCYLEFVELEGTSRGTRPRPARTSSPLARPEHYQVHPPGPTGPRLFTRIENRPGTQRHRAYEADGPGRPIAV